MGLTMESLKETSITWKFTKLVTNSRKKLLKTTNQIIVQPVPLIQFETIDVTQSNTQHIPTGLTPQAHLLLSQIPAPIYIIAFTGFGRSGKSFIASKLKEFLTDEPVPCFQSAPGNVPCTHGIDLMVFKHPTREGHFVFLDCEGGGNHNQSALPFVIGLAARLASMLFVFERGCFTTNGLDTVMQMINVGMATKQSDVDITKSLVLCENMTINQGVSSDQLVHDLLSETSGDEITNRVRRLVKERFDVEFAKIPYSQPGNDFQSNEHDDCCIELSSLLAESVEPFCVGNVPVDGTIVLEMAEQLLTQIKRGGKRYNMVSATEAMVSNMATEAAHTVWSEFVQKCRREQLHPSQITGRKHLKTLLREVEGISNLCLIELESFINRLAPAEPAQVAHETWDRNYSAFVQDLKAAHQRKASELAYYTAWAERVNRLITSLIVQVLTAIRQLLRFARFSTGLILMSNYYVWKQSLSVMISLATQYVMPFNK